MVWLRDGEKLSKTCLLSYFERIHECDGRTDGQTPHDGRPRLCIASRGEKPTQSQQWCHPAWLSCACCIVGDICYISGDTGHEYIFSSWNQSMQQLYRAGMLTAWFIFIYDVPFPRYCGDFSNPSHSFDPLARDELPYSFCYQAVKTAWSYVHLSRRGTGGWRTDGR